MLNKIGFRVLLFLFVISVAMLGIGFWIGGKAGLLCAVLLAILMNLGAYWFSVTAILSRFVAVPIIPSEGNKELFNALHKLCAKANVPVPRLYAVSTPALNAFVVGRSVNRATIAISSGALENFSGGELIALMSQAVAHISSGELAAGTVAASMATFITMLGNTKMWKSFFGFGSRSEQKEELMGTFSLKILAPIASGIIRLLIPKSKRAGYFYDQEAIRICGEEKWVAALFEKLKSKHTIVFFERAEANPGAAHLFVFNPIKDKRLVNQFGFQEPVANRLAQLEMTH